MTKENVMADSTEKWQGVRIERYDAGQPDLHRVVFFPRFLQHARGPGGAAKRVEEPAEVLVRTGAEPAVVQYTPPEVELSGISRQDYERKAVDVVRANETAG